MNVVGVHSANVDEDLKVEFFQLPSFTSHNIYQQIGQVEHSPDQLPRQIRHDEYLFVKH